ncbi:hypothetical protein B0H19DRAFT_171710 [Mycena capillaripes]|nr:hypothetical protein B0H19DRAFT_171710 [Mycena capillaripes]
MAHPGILSSLNFSNNPVEVGALTALVGSSAAEALVLGNRGPAGVAWATMSCFGTISVVRACFCGALSPWLRENLGIRTAASDAAVGLELVCDSRRSRRVRRNIGEPLAVFCHGKQKLAKGPNSRRLRAAWGDVYALDYPASMRLRSIPDNPLGSPLEVFTYAQYPFFRYLNSQVQIPALALSCAKMAEIYVLWARGASRLGLISATPWLFFFIGAASMTIRQLLRARTPEFEFGTLDIVAGKLPTLRRPGGPRKVILGLEENSRTSLLWRLFWSAGALISTASILWAYLILGGQAPLTVLIWAGFQLLWLGLRILVYHITDPADPMALRMLVVRPWATLTPDLKERVIDLTFAVAQCQTYTHPRGDSRYKEEAFTAHELELLLDGTEPPLPAVFPLPDVAPSSVQVDIRTVFGDTSIASAMWITGSDATPMDLYDTCIVVFSIRSSSDAASPARTIAVPAARMFSGVSALLADSEKSVPLSCPRG